MILPKLIFIMLMSLFLVGCPSTGLNDGYDDFLGKFNYGGNTGNGDGAGLEYNNYDVPNSGKGVIVKFSNDKPPNPINGDFEVEVLVANYMGSYDATLAGATTVNLDVYDTIELGGYEDQIDVSLSLDSPIFDGKQFSKPSIFVFNSNRNSNYDGNINAATNTQFIAKVEYDVMTETEVNFCVSNPDKEFDSKCNSQTIQIDKVNDRYPVRITSISKNVIGKSGNNAEVTLDINIADQGGGEVSYDLLYGSGFGGKYFGFNMFTSDGSFLTCTSKENIDKSKQFDSEAINLPMVLDLSSGKAVVQCKLLVSMNSPTQQVKFKINTEYGYEYTEATQSIKVNG